jgi:hypothetical protein
MTLPKINPPASVYDDLRRGLETGLRNNCHKNICGDHAYTVGHNHKKWAQAYIDWLIKLAVVSDMLAGETQPRLPRDWMDAHPAERMEDRDALRRSA